MTLALLFHETDAELARRQGPDAQEYWGAWSRYIDLLADEGVLVRGAGSGLQEPKTARTVRVQDGRTVVQDGPFADTKEMLGGFVLITV
ncbi:MAG: YciI family protein, partial [Fimbriimonadaceae bacterium]|nr:YciI family protein [Fimbriimonadaceae bacterium]